MNVPHRAARTVRAWTPLCYSGLAARCGFHHSRSHAALLCLHHFCQGATAVSLCLGSLPRRLTTKPPTHPHEGVVSWHHWRQINDLLSGQHGALHLQHLAGGERQCGTGGRRPHAATSMPSWSVAAPSAPWSPSISSSPTRPAAGASWCSKPDRLCFPSTSRTCPSWPRQRRARHARALGNHPGAQLCRPSVRHWRSVAHLGRLVARAARRRAGRVAGRRAGRDASAATLPRPAARSG